MLPFGDCSGWRGVFGLMWDTFSDTSDPLGHYNETGTVKKFKVGQRVRKAEEEEPVGRALADHIVVNDQLDRTVDEMLDLITHHRARHRGPSHRA